MYAVSEKDSDRRKIMTFFICLYLPGKKFQDFLRNVLQSKMSNMIFFCTFSRCRLIQEKITRTVIFVSIEVEKTFKPETGLIKSYNLVF